MRNKLKNRVLSHCVRNSTLHCCEWLPSPAGTAATFWLQHVKAASLYPVSFHSAILKVVLLCLRLYSQVMNQIPCVVNPGIPRKVTLHRLHCKSLGHEILCGSCRNCTKRNFGYTVTNFSSFHSIIAVKWTDPYCRMFTVFSCTFAKHDG